MPLIICVCRFECRQTLTVKRKEEQKTGLKKVERLWMLNNSELAAHGASGPAGVQELQPLMSSVLAPHLCPAHTHTYTDTMCISSTHKAANSARLSTPNCFSPPTPQISDLGLIKS